MTTIDQHIRDLIQFYVKTNYEHYLTEQKLSYIPDEEIDTVINHIYDQRKGHLKDFLKESLKKLLKHECPGDLALLNIFSEIFENDALCRNRLVMEIKLYQNDK